MKAGAALREAKAGALNLAETSFVGFRVFFLGSVSVKTIDDDRMAAV